MEEDARGGGRNEAGRGFGCSTRAVRPPVGRQDPRPTVIERGERLAGHAWTRERGRVPQRWNTMPTSSKVNRYTGGSSVALSDAGPVARRGTRSAARVVAAETSGGSTRAKPRRFRRQSTRCCCCCCSVQARRIRVSCAGDAAPREPASQLATPAAKVAETAAEGAWCRQHLPSPSRPPYSPPPRGQQWRTAHRKRLASRLDRRKPETGARCLAETTPPTSTAPLHRNTEASDAVCPHPSTD